MNSKLRFWLTFVLILSLSVVVNQFFFDTRGYVHLNKNTRNILELSTIFLTGLTGLIYFSQPSLAKLRLIWLVLYIGSLLFLLATILIDYFVFTLEKNGQYRFVTLKSMMTSPIVFLVLVLINKLYFVPAKPKK
jgi:hypothetical protein